MSRSISSSRQASRRRIAALTSSNDSSGRFIPAASFARDSMPALLKSFISRTFSNCLNRQHSPRHPQLTHRLQHHKTAGTTLALQPTAQAIRHHLGKQHPHRAHHAAMRAKHQQLIHVHPSALVSQPTTAPPAPRCAAATHRGRSAASTCRPDRAPAPCRPSCADRLRGHRV